MGGVTSLESKGNQGKLRSMDVRFEFVLEMRCLA
jgi:hypothetical protein